MTTAPGGELPEGYLDDALDLIRERAFYADRVDWPAVQVEARRRAGDLVESVDDRPVEGDEVVRLPRAGVGGQADVSLATSRPALLPRPPPVAVLTSRLTGSAGEGVAMAFRGRPAHAQLRRADGRRPHGNAQHRLPDGAELYLTEGIGVARTGRTHERRLRPDQPVATNLDPVRHLGRPGTEGRDRLARRALRPEVLKPGPGATTLSLWRTWERCRPAGICSSTNAGPGCVSPGIRSGTWWY